MAAADLPRAITRIPTKKSPTWLPTTPYRQRAYRLFENDPRSAIGNLLILAAKLA
jgi:hypothetical protein